MTGLSRVLSQAYPDYTWTSSSFSITQQGRRATQRALLKSIQLIFPKELIIEEFRRPDLIFEGSGSPMSIDVCLPARRLAVEFQGEPHCQNSPHFGSSSGRKARDDEKKKRLENLGFVVVHVPFYWDGTEASLRALINEVGAGPV